MKRHPSSSFRKFFHSCLYIGPLAFLCGSAIILYGESANQAETILIGLISGAAGLIIWGFHGMRRRGMRPGFVLMTTFGTLFFLMQLYYRYSDYRWAQISTMSFASPSEATMTHLETRVVMFLSIFLISIIIGLLPPLPAAKRRQKDQPR